MRTKILLLFCVISTMAESTALARRPEVAAVAYPPILPVLNLAEHDALTLFVEHPGPIIEDVAMPDIVLPSAARVKYTVERHIDEAVVPVDISQSGYDGDDVLLFRKNPMRNADFGGTVTGTPSAVEVVWKFDTAMKNTPESTSTWGGGSGWTGQPLYISESNEIVVGSLCGKVYFIDYASGKATRTPLDVKNPIKGTVSLDPKFENLYVGHGIPDHRPFGTSTFDLGSHTLTCSIDRDPKALRGWGAYDSNAICVGDYLFWCGENGSFYKFRREQGRLTPVATLRYTVDGFAPGIENSLCVYRNYGFFGDNRGNIICVNLDTMQPVWHYDNHDDIDATIVCMIERGHPFIYTGCEVDKQGESGLCHLVKLNALTGEEVWERRIEANRFVLGEKYFDGGLYGTPLPGRGNCEGMLFANVVRNGADGGKINSGELTAFDMQSGEIIYTTKLDIYAWSSPVGYLNERGEMFILTGDTGGKIYLINALTGAVIFKRQVGANFESSPVVIGNTAVVGSRYNGIYKLEIK